MTTRLLWPVALMLPMAAFGAVEDVTDVAPVVVTATRTPETAGETLASVTVIGRAEIERRQSLTMSDILRGLPGVAVDNSGGRGQSSSVFLRGSNSDHVLVLIDGVKIGSATLGTTPWQNIPVDQIERVEVVRGPRSSLYGSEAIGGVIQIFTRKGQGGALTPRVSAGAGTYQSVTASIGLSGGNQQGWFDVGAGLDRTRGFNACNGEPFVGGCFVYQPDKDGYKNGNLSARAGWRASEAFELDANYLRSEGDVQFDGDIYAGNESQTLTQVLGARALARPLSGWTSILSVGRSWDDSEVSFEGVHLDRYDTRRDTISWQNDVQVTPRQLLTLGLDYQKDRIASDRDYAEDSRDDVGVFGEYIGQFGAHELQLSLRQDDNQQFGSHQTGNGAWGYQFSNGMRLTLSYGTAFKAPTFNELYYPGFGNPDLGPEQSWSAEIGLSGDLPWGAWSANLYRTEIDDLIAFDAALMSPQNIDKARIQGLELWSTAEIAGWSLDGNLTLLDPRDASSGPSNGNLLPRRPEQTLRIDADRRFGRFGVGATLFMSGRRYDDLSNDVQLDGYSLLDLRAEYAFTDALRLQGRVENLLDAQYETAAWYNQPGRALFVTLRYEP